MAKSQRLSNLPNAPAFSADRATSAQSISSGTWTKVQFNNELFDTASAYDNSTNYRFTPQVAGYYQVDAGVYINGSSITQSGINIYKNGSSHKTGTFLYPSSTNDTAVAATGLVYLNGSTDYIELYVYVVGSSLAVPVSSGLQHFSAVLVRPAA